MSLKDKSEIEITRKSGKKFSLILSLTFIVIGTYFLILRKILNPEQVQDFTSFYAALGNLIHHENPYTQLISNFLPKTEKLTPNLNPPFVLLVFSPLAQFSYATAMKIWLFLSFILGLLGASIAFYYAVSIDFLKKYWLYFYLVYFSFFATMANLSVMQLGAILLFFIMLGYHFYIREQNLFAGLAWSIAISFKLFPALLFFFLVKQRRIRLAFCMLLATALAFSLPYFFYGQLIYSQYIDLMSRVFWYGDNWNASFFGYVSRLFINPQDIKHHLVSIELIYASLFFVSLLSYLKKLGPPLVSQTNHQPFCLTLTMMLFMSPFGWLYYFPILIFPIILTWADANNCENNSVKIMLIWLIGFMLINFPQGYAINTQTTRFSTNLIANSFYFYSLTVFTFLCARKRKLFTPKEISLNENSYGFLLAILFILFFTITVTVLKFTLNLFK